MITETTPATAQTAIQLLKADKQTLQAITMFNYGDQRDVSSIVANEISFLEAIAITKPELLQCDHRTVTMAMKFVLKNNLSFDPNAGLVYVKTRSIALVKDEKGTVTKWGKAMEIQPTCEGKLSIAYQCGKILDHERPTVKKDATGKVIEVTFKYLKPSIPAPRWVEVTFDESDFKRWQIASHKENGRGKQDAATRSYANPNYTSFNGGVDPEFARAKSIVHATKKMGTNANERINVNSKPVLTNTIDPIVDKEVTNEAIPDSTPEYTPFNEQVNDAPQDQINIPESL